jgi:hypothetical protein
VATAKVKEAKTKKKKSTKVKAAHQEEQLKMSALFANAGNARKIAFAIDISGSMGHPEGSFGGMTRMDVVKAQMVESIKSMENAPYASFGIVSFNQSAHTLLGGQLLTATPANVARGVAAVQTLQAGGGNGGEAACLNACLAMRGVQAIFFLGDGGWSAQELITAVQARRGRATIHSIAFFMSEYETGGLPDIAKMTGGTFRSVKGQGDLQTDGVEAEAADGEDGWEGENEGDGGEGGADGEGGDSNDDSDDGDGSDDDDSDDGDDDDDSDGASEGTGDYDDADGDDDDDGGGSDSDGDSNSDFDSDSDGSENTGDSQQ